ncbi:hypothetical protein K493DRAFT_92663 [Basidiobolus meristosporus CBS 931.73]|uniref:Rap-GAP domain-containing protein n=1 Tax=Basidiobolus meristosporus CBS 931.73 TaxID=1314790 RepID=A0A1Y1X9Y9_9FUNG|nr:hypothetical protein K493DRAFT_92663 [Basidiobolus meristosporus CBS 931.73]|eukprot:ORX82164.1 hypothetical protein K493DRAFT_92663 [Basidiobolus meristosporus CBS 931.73]
MNALLYMSPITSRLSIRRPHNRKTPQKPSSTSHAHEPSTPASNSSVDPEPDNSEADKPVISNVSVNLASRFNLARMLTGRDRDTAPPTPESRLEKLLKKAKPFFDERNKPRLRLLALWNLLDLADDLDQAVFFQEHADKIYSAIYNSFITQADKIRKRSERPTSFNSKDMVTLIKILMLLRKLFLLLPDRIRDGWHQDEIADIFTQILSSNNCHKLREIGLRLLLIWINVQTSETPDVRELYRNAIPLSIFLQEVGRSDLALDQETIGDPSCIPIYPATQFLRISEVGELIQLVLENITYLAHVAAGSIPPCDKIRILETDDIKCGVAVGVGIDAAYASAKFMFELFKNHYLVKLFPRCARRVGLVSVPKDQVFGFPTCPPSALHRLVGFLVEHCVDELKGNPQTTTSPACPILKTIILGSQDNREFIHDIIANALSLPIHDMLNLESARGAAYILAVWMLSGENERPSFLRRNPGDGSFAQANGYLRQYFSMLTSVLETGFECYDNHFKQEILIREVLSIFRAVSQNGTIQLEDETWESLLVLLINSFIVYATKAQEVSNSYLSDDLVEYFFETLFYVWARSMTRNERLWSKLNTEILKTSKWIQIIDQWRSVLCQLTRILGEVYYELNCELTRQPKKTRLQRPTSGSVMARKPAKTASSISESNDRDDNTLTVYSHASGVSNDTRKGKGDGEGTLNRSSSHVRLFNLDSNNTFNENNFAPFKSLIFPMLKDQESESTSTINRRLTIEFANIEDSGFTYLMSLNWDKDRIFSTWKNFLHLLGNPNHIADPVARTNAIRCLVEIWDTLAQIRAHQPYDAACKPDLLEFAPWLFEASEMSSVYREGYLVAFGCICRMLCRLHHTEIEEAYYSQFYRILLRGLSIKDNELHHILFVNCRKLFGLSLPGCPAVIPSFLTVIKSTLHSSARYMSHYVNELMCQNAVTILLSMLCFPNHFPTLRIPNLLSSINFPTGRESIEYLHADKLKNELEQVLFSCIAETRKLNRLTTKTGQTHSMLINGACVMAFDELISTPNPSISLIQTCIRTILDHMYCRVFTVAISAVECLYTFSGYTDRLRALDQGLVYDIIGNLIEAINSHIRMVDTETISETGFVVAKLFYCLLEWIMCSPSEIMSHSGLRQMIFATLERAIHLSPPEKSDLASQADQIKGYTNFDKISQPFIRPSTLVKTIFQKGDGSNAEDAESSPNIIQESGEIVLVHLLNHFSNQAAGQGSFSEGLELSTSSQFNEENVSYFIYNNNTLLTLIGSPSGDEGVKILARNMTGTFQWDPQVFREAPSSDLLDSQIELPKKIQKMMGELPRKEQPKITHQSKSSSDDSSPSELPRTPSGKSEEAEHTLPVRKDSLNTTSDATGDDIPEATYRPERASRLQRRKTLLLSKLGMLNQSLVGEESFVHLSPTSSLTRDIRGLDKKPGRETIKIGVLYVGPGQEDESSILSNSKGSEAYEKFLHELGQEVSLDTHKGYLGGLERNQTTGKTAIYYSSTSVEMMFHDATRIPTDPSDAKQLKKKRHIGNDHVHIVWNEHHREYRRETIGGDFGNVQIIITPTSNGLFAIDIFRDPEIQLFGPVLDGMVLPSSILAPLVRMTALNASRYAIYCPSTLYRHPYTHRVNDIKKICKRHGSQKWTYNQFVTNFTSLSDNRASPAN